MIAMVKKREDRVKAKVITGDSDSNLDGDYRSPIHSFRDLSLGNIRSVLLGSRYVQILLALILIGGFLRFYDLGFNSLWLDEASTYTLSLGSIPQIWQETTAGEFNPPLFYWLEHLMLTIGNNEFILRFIPALLGVLTIPLIYLVGREFIDRNVGIIAATAFAFSPFLIYYSQEARAYSMMLFFVAFAMVFYLRALKTNDTPELGAVWCFLCTGVLVPFLCVCYHRIYGPVCTCSSDPRYPEKHQELFADRGRINSFHCAVSSSDSCYNPASLHHGLHLPPHSVSRDLM